MLKNLDGSVLALVASSRAALPHPAHVLSVGHRFEMLRIAAQLVLAEVVNLMTWGQIAVGQPPRHLRRRSFAVSLGHANFTESAITLVSARQPRPAFIFASSVDLLPKAFGFISNLTHHGRI